MENEYLDALKKISTRIRVYREARDIRRNKYFKEKENSADT